MNAIETNLMRYLETESLLNNFFKRFGYCASMCIKPAVESSAAGSAEACCRKKYYKLYDLGHPAFDLLRQERERLYGKPDDNRTGPDSPCEYHDPRTGCQLKTHKSPTCLAFLCPEAIAALRNEYGIFAYDYLGVNYALEWILTGDFPDPHFYAFRESILNMTKRVADNRLLKNPPKCSVS
ncbi:MAG: hypothetical protein AB1427_19765 [Thermodesulfobacteriota bacterium]